MIDFPFKAGQHLIEASAGTGKTYTLMQIILRLLIGQASHDGRAYDIREILVVTFTQAATQELNHRLSELLRDAALAFEQSESRDPMIQSCIDASANLRLDLNRIRRASLTLNEASVYTIHGFCSQVLRATISPSAFLPISRLKPTNLRTLYALPKTSSVFMCCHYHP